ncbi:MAG: hypothetical protein ABIP54_02340, partial [Candidatus Andersenbacteria bacterium]
MLKLFRTAGILLIIIALIVGGLLYLNGRIFQKSVQVPEVVGATKAVPALTALLVQNDPKTSIKKVLVCSDTGCTVKPIPQSAGEDPLTDGTSWYKYTDSKNKNNKTITTLERVQNNGTTEKISEQNDLVKPRGLIMSQDGVKVAYFLDNIHDNKDLTELWVYDSAQGGAKVVAENLVQNNIATRVRWNASSRIAWFLQDGKTKQLIAVPVQDKAEASAKFASVDWEHYSAVADTGIMDINDDASVVAFAQPTFFGFSQLTIAQDSGQITKQSIKGNVVFARWMKNNALFYAVQDGANLTFWIVNSAGERPIARMSAQFTSAHSSGSSDLAAFVASPRDGETHLYVLQISTGLVKDETTIPSFSGDTYVVQANEAQVEESAALASISGQLTDEELLAFVNDHIKDITQDSQAKAERMLSTSSKNTVYIDYTSGNLSE